MTADLQLLLNCNECTDLSIACGDLIRQNDLSTAISISLFTDRRAREDDVIPNGKDPRGWVGDAIDGQQWGSRLWLLESERSTPETLRRAIDYGREALVWLKNDGVVGDVSFDAFYNEKKDSMIFVVVVCRNDETIKIKYQYAWKNIKVLGCFLN